MVSSITLAETELLAGECLELASAEKIKSRLENFLATL